MSSAPAVRGPHRAPAIVLILLLLALAIVANATIKRHRSAEQAAPSAALSMVQRAGTASSSAWYCAGPLPLGLKKAHASLVLANVSSRPTAGELVVTSEAGVISSQAISVAANSAKTLRLPSPKKPVYAAATVLSAGSGLAVREAIDGTAGRDTSACVSHATTTQYLAGGATTRPSTMVLSIFDPSATPAVASIAFATPGGVITPPAYQGMPISAGTTLVVDVGRYLPSVPLLGTTVTSSGGPIVVGAVESEQVGHPMVPSLVGAAAVPEKQWWFAPAPAGTTTRQRYSILNPGSAAVVVKLTTNGVLGPANQSTRVPPGGIAALTPAAESALGALRWAVVTSTGPVVVSRSVTLLGPSTTKRPIARTGVERIVDGLPAGFSVAAPTPVPARGWLIGDGGSDAGIEAVVLIANPSTRRATVSFTSLSGYTNPSPVTIAAGGTDLVSISGNEGGGVVLVDATVPIVVASGTYAKSVGAIGWSSPGATVVG